MEPDRVFFDGTCGLCHRAVRFALHRDAEGCAFRFAPLQGETLALTLNPGQRAQLPDSLVVVDAAGRVYTRSAAMVRILRRLNQPWRGLGGLLGWVPSPLRDLGYDLLAKARRWAFETPQEACPVVAKTLRNRFLP